jgi:hypothetical protein
LSREVVVTKKGKIYTYRGTEDPAQRDRVHRIWAYDLKTNASTETAYTATGGFWNGQTWTRDGETIYLATVNGELYKLDVETEVFTHLGHFLPKEEHGAGVRVDYLYGITLSAEEKRIYGIPRPSRSGGSNLYSYEIATGAITLGNWSQPSTPAATCVIRRVISTLPGLVTASLGKVKCAFPSCIPPDSRGNINLARFGDGEFGELLRALPSCIPPVLRSFLKLAQPCVGLELRRR